MFVQSWAKILEFDLIEPLNLTFTFDFDLGAWELLLGIDMLLPTCPSHLIPKIHNPLNCRLSRRGRPRKSWRNNIRGLTDQTVLPCCAKWEGLTNEEHVVHRAMLGYHVTQESPSIGGTGETLRHSAQKQLALRVKKLNCGFVSEIWHR